MKRFSDKTHDKTKGWLRKFSESPNLIAAALIPDRRSLIREVTRWSACLYAVRMALRHRLDDELRGEQRRLAVGQIGGVRFELAFESI